MPVSLDQPETAATAVPDQDPMAAMMQLLFGKHITYSLSAIARLGVPDHMGVYPVSVNQLARQVGAHAPSLYRVMRTLASVGVFEAYLDQQFALTAVGELLKSDCPQSMRPFAIQIGDSWATRAFEHFTDTVRTGEDGVSKAFGKNIFEYFADQPEEAENFNRSMTSFSQSMGEAIATGYDFSGIQRLADVGGGHGMLLGAVLQRHPEMRGVVYDLPEVVAGATSQPHFAACAGRIDVEAGSFFERVPAGCDAYMMKFILHDWSDEHCRTILKCIRKQLRPGGRVLVCEQVVGTETGPSFAKLIDLEMLAMTVGGKERTVREFDDLFASAGLRLVQVHPTKSPVCVLEARLA